MKTFVRTNAFTLFVLVAAIFLFVTLPSQIAIGNSKAAITPRFFPQLCINIIIISCVIALGGSVIESIKDKKENIVRKVVKNSDINVMRSVGVIVSLFIWYFILPIIGFTISTSILMAIIMYVLGCRKKTLIVAIPIGFTIGIYMVFSKLLNVNLPEILF